MINSIEIKNIATFDSVHGIITDLKKVNFFYGANGSGKTTISRVLANPSSYNESKISWENDEAGDIIVYNHDFVNGNFNSSSEIPGIYTLGEGSIEIEKKIEQLRDDYKKKQDEKRKVLNGISEDSIKEYFEEKKNECRYFYENDCWKLKESVKGTELDEFLSGFRGSKSKLFEKITAEYQKNDSPKWTKEQLITYLQQKKRAEVSRMLQIGFIKNSELQTIEVNPLFRESVIGKSNSTIGKLIEKVGNSQWVLNGKKYIEKSEGKCPFCQQQLPDGFSKMLEDYFDYTYTEKIESLKKLEEHYKKEAENFLNQISDLLSTREKQYQYLDQKKLQEISAKAECLLKSNLMAIAEKINIPSNVVNIQSSSELIAAVNKLIEVANEKIIKYNKSIDEPEEVENISDIFWRYAVSQNEKSIVKYFEKQRQLEGECTTLQKEIAKLNSEMKIIVFQARELEKQRVSIRPTIDKINGILKNFGFTNFRLQVAPNESQYQIVRMDGSLANETLSEGETNFITFLYFYFLLDGSNDVTISPGEKVIVIDDPVSSLDSNVLYIVSTLISDICKNKILKDSMGFSQLLFFTHNVYFYNEVVSSSPVNKKKASYYIVRKQDNISSIEYHESSPIKTTYQMMWGMVKKAKEDIKKVDKIALLNVMRRILEYYFRTLGSSSNAQVYNSMDGEDKYLCHSLLTLENSQSHSFIDDTVNSTPDEETLRRYLEVFRKIFEAHNSLSHYNMMMGIVDEKQNNS